jgi:type III secretory pathway lipoprotein EscJ
VPALDRVSIGRVLHRYGLILCCILLASCGKETLIENTTQKRAVQIVVALYKQGITATSSRESGGQGKYKVQIAARDYAQALAVIERDGLMEDPAPSMSDLTASSSFFPSSREMEALRLDYALSQEVKGLLEALSGVDHAQVLVRRRFGAREEVSPTVSVVIRTQGNANVSEAVLTEVLKRSVPGLEADRILLSIEPGVRLTDGQGSLASPNDGSEMLIPFLFNWRVPRTDYKGFALLFLSCMALVGLVGLGFGYVLGKIREKRNRPQTDLGENVNTNSRIERPRRDLLEG